MVSKISEYRSKMDQHTFDNIWFGASIVFYGAIIYFIAYILTNSEIITDISPLAFSMILGGIIVVIISIPLLYLQRKGLSHVNLWLYTPNMKNMSKVRFYFFSRFSLISIHVAALLLFIGVAMIGFVSMNGI